MKHHPVRTLLALSATPGLGRILVRRLLERFGSPETVFGASEGELAGVEGMTRARLDALRRPPQFASADREIALADRAGVRLLGLTDPDYPSLLRSIVDPPPVLYAKGALPDDVPRVAVVGSRGATPYGLRVARRLARDLAAAGVTVVSGLALGVDAEAHEGCLEGGGATVAVLANGLSSVFPLSNRALGERIPLLGGALVSEFPMEDPASPERFPIRNRIVSGLCRATVVVQATRQSGALITAGQALEQGREVYAVPGSVESPLSAGTNWLLQQGAKPVTCAADVLEELGLPVPPAPAPAAPELSDEDRAVWAALADETHVDDVIEKSGLTASRAAAALSRLELRGLVRQAPGKRFARSEGR